MSNFKPNYFQRRSKPQGPKANDRIRALDVQVIGSDGGNLGAMPLKKAIELATEIAENAPLALVSLREQLRSGIQEAVQAATDIEGSEQFWLTKTDDHFEGVQAVSERRVGNFTGK